MNPVIHFEMAAQDRQRMADFYSTTFGWQTQMLGEEMGGYVLATTAESDETGRPKMGGAINGGFYPKMEDPALNAPSVVIGVGDINDHMKKVTAAGGKIIISSLNGIVLTITPGDAPQPKIQANFGEKIFATPAVADNALYLRSATHLWAFRDVR